MIRIFFLIAVISFGILFSGCKKEEENITEEDLIDYAAEDALADDLFDEIAVQAARYDSENTDEKGACAPDITSSGSEYPRTVTLDYGQEGCEGWLGHERKGKLHIEISAPFWQEGSVKTIKPEDFSIDGYKLEGTKTLSYMGKNDEGKHYQTVSLRNGVIHFPDGTTILRETDRTRTWSEGDDSPLNFTDDIWTITGKASGTTRLGESYTNQITNPLLFDLSCRWKLVQGEITVEVPEHTIVINYGSGKCDNETNVNIDGQEYNVNRR